MATTKKTTARKRKSALGKGLSALIPTTEDKMTSGAATGKVSQVEIGLIFANPSQPRRNFPEQELNELAESIAEHGILQPILLRPTSSNKAQYEIVAGERRFRAAQKAALNTVPAIIKPLDDKESLEIAIIENVQRLDISSLDQAFAYQRLRQEFGLSQEQIAQRVAKSRAAIANTLRLLDLPKEVQDALASGEISEGHGRAILGAKTETSRRAVFRQVLRNGLTVRQTEQLARKSDKTRPPSLSKEAFQQSAEEKHVEQRLQQVLGTRVQLQPTANGGKIVIEYFSADELEGLLERLGY